MYKDKRALVETLRKYKKHILGPLFTEAADTIEVLLDEKESKSDSCPIEIEPGHWIFITADDPENDQAGLFKHRYKCSVCGNWQTYGTTDFCPNCGADMREENEDEKNKT